MTCFLVSKTYPGVLCLVSVLFMPIKIIRIKNRKCQCYTHRDAG